MATSHPEALQTLYASLLEGARSQTTIPLQTPGTAVRKTVKGQEYTYWRSYTADGRRQDEYLGVASDVNICERIPLPRPAGSLANP